MKIRALKRHIDSNGVLHIPGTDSAEYEDTKINADQKIASGMVEEIKAKSAPENKKAPRPENKAD